MGVEGVAEEFKDTAILLAAGCDHRPDAFTPPLSAFATGSLCDVTVDHDVPNRLFRLVVRRIDPWRRQEANVIVRLPAAKTLGERLGLRTRRRVADHLEKSSLDPMHRTGKTRLRHLLRSMPGVKQLSREFRGRHTQFDRRGHSAGSFGSSALAIEQGSGPRAGSLAL